MNQKLEIIRKRRLAFQDKMESNSIALFFSSNLKSRNNDVSFCFRQDSDFYYLTGFNEDCSILVLTNKEEKIYIHGSDIDKEIWDGPRLNIEKSFEELGIKNSKNIKDFEKDLESILENKDFLYYKFGFNKSRDENIFGLLRKILDRKRGGVDAPNQIINPEIILHKLRLYKDEYEIEILKKCAEITYNGHLSILKKTKVGMYEFEVAADLEYEFYKSKASLAYPSIVASGVNSCILHYIKNDKQIKSGELLLVDAAAELDCLCTDVTRTFPVEKKFSPLQNTLYKIVLNAQMEAIKEVKQNSNLEIIHDVAVKILIQGLIDLNIISGSVDDNFNQSKEIELEAKKTKNPNLLKNIPYRNFYMHRTSHWLGMDVHDVGNYYSHEKPVSLEKGMLLTIEPGLYFSPKVVEEFNLNPELKGIGIRIEDDILVTEDSNLNLTSKIPKTIYEIEEIRSSV